MKAVLGECGKISILSATDAVNICLGHLVWWVRCQAGVCNFFSVCANAQPSVINDNELYFLGTAGLMDNISQREQSGQSQIFYLSVSRWSSCGPVVKFTWNLSGLWFISLWAETHFLLEGLIPSLKRLTLSSVRICQTQVAVQRRFFVHVWKVFSKLHD